MFDFFLICMMISCLHFIIIILWLTEDSAISDYISWLRDSYDKVWKILIGLMSNQSVCEHASSTLFTLLGQEGKFPIRVPKKGQYYFPNDKFQVNYCSHFILIKNMKMRIS